MNSTEQINLAGELAWVRSYLLERAQAPLPEPPRGGDDVEQRIQSIEASLDRAHRYLSDQQSIALPEGHGLSRSYEFSGDQETRLVGGDGIDIIDTGDVKIIKLASTVAEEAKPPVGSVSVDKTGFWAKIGANAADGTNRWKYAWTEQTKSSAGYGGWGNLSGGRSGTTGISPARNSIEDMNDGTGVQGNGVDIDGTAFPAGFSVQACPANNIVWMESVSVGTAVEYWFSYENGIDGTCS